MTIPLPTLWQSLKCAVTGDYCEDYYNRVFGHRVLLNSTVYQVIDVEPGAWVLDEVTVRGYLSCKQPIHIDMVGDK